MSLSLCELADLYRIQAREKAYFDAQERRRAMAPKNGDGLTFEEFCEMQRAKLTPAEYLARKGVR